MASNTQTIVYEGEVYVRPVGRGIALEDEVGRPHLDEWIERWLSELRPGRGFGGYRDRLRIVVETPTDDPA
jgi:hypothetical protein